MKVRQTEKEFRQMVCDAAMALGWKQQYHTWSSLHSPKGFPDCILIREQEDGTARLLAIECKTGNRQPTPEQLEWLRLFALVPGCRAFCFWPSEWDALVTVLK